LTVFIGATKQPLENGTSNLSFHRCHEATAGKWHLKLESFHRCHEATAGKWHLKLEFSSVPPSNRLKMAPQT